MHRRPTRADVSSGGSVAATTSSTVTPGASSTSLSPSGVTSMTARSVMMRSTTPLPVSGSEHSFTIFGEPSLATCSMSTMRAAGAVHEVHRAAGALDHLAGDHPVGEVARGRDLHGAEDRGVDLAAADHAEARRRVEVRGTRQHRDGLLAGVDEVGVDLVFGRVRADAEDAVLGLQQDRDAVGHVVRHERRQADAEVHVRAVGELLRGAGRHLETGECHAQFPSRTVRRSMRFSMSAPTTTMRST